MHMREKMQMGQLRLDTEQRLLYPEGDLASAVRLTPIEARLLAALAQFSGQIVNRSYLMEAVWQTRYLGDTRILDVHMCYLRRKLKQFPDQGVEIVTRRGRGYRLELGK